MQPEDFEHVTLQAGGIDIHVATCGDRSSAKGLVLFVHGWPESWYSWRHQMPAAAKEGWFAAAMDVRGYGGSSKPHDIADYRMSVIVRDVAGVVDALGFDQAVIVGHDWGAPIVWNTALAHPQKIRGVMGLSVPFMGRGEVPPLDLWKTLYTDNNKFFYQIYFLREGVAEAELEADLDRTLRTIYYSASSAGMKEGRAKAGAFIKDASSDFLSGTVEPRPMDWLPEKELAYYVEQFEKGGMRGPLNRYRAQNMDWRESEGSEQVIKVPAAFTAGEDDPVLNFIDGVDVMEMQKKNFTDLRFATTIAGAGHWVQQEKPQQVNEALLRFLSDVG